MLWSIFYEGVLFVLYSYGSETGRLEAVKLSVMPTVSLESIHSLLRLEPGTNWTLFSEPTSNTTTLEKTKDI